MKPGITKAGIWQIIRTICGLLCITVLLSMAFLFPKYYCKFSDKNILNKTNHIEVNIDTYETAYSSFYEKIRALARAESIGNTIHAVRINNSEVKTEKDELTHITNTELEKLYHSNILPVKIKVKEKKLTLCEHYTFYETGQNNSFKGISCWKLIYENKRKKITLYLDEEYQKIYYLDIQQKKAIAYDAFVRLGKAFYSSKTDFNTTGFQEFFPVLLENLLSYYDLPLYSEVSLSEVDPTNLLGIITFDDAYQISVLENFSLVKDKNLYYIWNVGIQIEEMIQF